MDYVDEEVKEKRILFVADKNMSFASRSLLTALKETKITIDVAELSTTSLGAIYETPDLMIIDAADYMDGQNTDVFEYVVDIARESEIKVGIIGYKEELDIILQKMPTHLIATLFTRPIDTNVTVKQIVDLVNFVADCDGKKHVLVVDDSGMMLRTVNSWLDGYYKVSLSNSAANAMKVLNTNKPDLILLDYEMPVCSGPQFLENIRKEVLFRDIPVLFLTTKNDPESVKRVVQLKPAGYILKTTPEEQVIQTIEDTLLKQKGR